MTIATTPGKLVLFGDYAVLEGAPAAAVSVDVRAVAQVDASDGRDSVFIDLAGGRAYDFVIEPGAGLRWIVEPPAARGALIAAVLDTCHELAHMKGAVPGLRISVNTDAFYTDVGGRVEKLGLGSSAAALVALTGALIATLDIPIERPSLLNLCHAAHRHFQGGRGSGVDVATALLGGVVGVRYRGDQPHPATTSLKWPRGLFMLPVWSGVGASTTELLARFYGYRAADEDGFAHHLRNLSNYARQADAAWRRGAVAEILSALTGFDDALRALDDDADIGINTEVHDHLRGVAERHGAVYKTSGAGGGDFGIVLTDSEGMLRAVADEMAGFKLLEARLNVAGLEISGG